MTGLRFLALSAARPAGNGYAGVFDAARWALILAMYAGMLLGLAHAVSKRIPAAAAALCLGVLALAGVFGASLAIENLEGKALAARLDAAYGYPGEILRRAHPGGDSVVLLGSPDWPGGSSVVATPGRPLALRNGPGSYEGLEAAAGASAAPSSFRGLSSDLRISGENLRQSLEGEGIRRFIIEAGSLVFLLGSLIFTLKLSAWPLLNFFFCALAFRGVLALEVLFSFPDSLEFASGVLPPSISLPVIFLAIGALAHLCHFMAYLGQRQARRARS
ncbi:MAG: hypothetical protein FWE09_07330 [Treponema sp.]|nr:hypothetical protein [Treponema sp.]